jgi:predicted HTH domain antitoxin
MLPVNFRQTKPAFYAHSILAFDGFLCDVRLMTLELPDTPTMRKLSPEDLRLELACALYARGKIGKVGGAELAGVDFFAFQGALGERRIESYTQEMLDQDVAAMRRLFPQ